MIKFHDNSNFAEVTLHRNLENVVNFTIISCFTSNNPKSSANIVINVIVGTRVLTGITTADKQLDYFKYNKFCYLIDFVPNVR